MGRNKIKIQITGSCLSDKRLAIVCEKIYLLRTARKIGDTEVINHTQLGRLKDNSLDIQFKILEL